MYKHNFLRKMNVFGWEGIEPVILAGLVLNAPILLLGHTGDGKTYAIKQIANALGIKEFQNYDASKALFEDIIGFPRFFEKNNEQFVEYAKTPLTIWDKEFVFIDEISRALPETQNKWLEVINNKQLMGVKLTNLKYIYLAMNPANDYIGVYDLDKALVERFYAIVKVPSLFDLSEENITKISINKENNKIKKNIYLIKYINDIKDKYNKLIKKNSFYKIGYNVSKILKDMDINELELSKNGRRLNILTKMTAVLLLMEDLKVSEMNIKIVFRKYLKYLLPFYINMEDYKKIDAAIANVLQIGLEDAEYYRLIKYLYSEKDEALAQIELKKMENDFKKEHYVTNRLFTREYFDSNRLKILAVMYFLNQEKYMRKLTILEFEIQEFWFYIYSHYMNCTEYSLNKAIEEKIGKNNYKLFKKYLREVEYVYKNVCV